MVSLDVVFAGADELVGSSAAAPFEGRPADAALSVTVPPPPPLSARLSETDPGAGLAGRQVRFLVDGTEVAAGTTDPAGRATAALGKRLKRNAVVDAVFDGDGTYGAVRSRAG